MAIFELEGCRVEGVRREEGARGGDVVCECAVALAEARLIAGLEVFMLDGNCSIKSASEPKQALIWRRCRAIGALEHPWY